MNVKTNDRGQNLLRTVKGMGEKTHLARLGKSRGVRTGKLFNTYWESACGANTYAAFGKRVGLAPAETITCKRCRKLMGLS